MPIDGRRFATERHKLCLWLEGEMRKLPPLPHELRARREAELEREFRQRLERLYGDAPQEPTPKTGN